MSRLAALMGGRLHSLSATQLRVIYSAIALISLLWVVLISLTHYLALASHTDECLWQTATVDNRLVLVVDSLFPGGAAEQAGVHRGDIVIAINGDPIQREGNVAYLSQYGQVALDMAPTGVPIPYLVQRDNQLIELSITLKDNNRPILQDLLPFVLPVVTFIWLIVGVMVVLSQPHGLLQRRFFLTAATSVFALAPTGFFQRYTPLLDIPANTALFLDGTQLLVGAFFFTFWLSFCASFPIERQVFAGAWKKIILWLPVIFIVTMLLLEATLPGQSLNQVGPNKWAKLVLALNGLTLLLWVGSFFGGVWLLYRGYRRLPAGIDRRPMRIILAGTLLTAFVPIYFIFMASGAKVIGSSGIQGQLFILPIFLLPALPVSFGYAIFKYQVMDFRRVVSTTAVYVVTMMLIVALYLGLGYAVGQLFGALPGRLGETLQIVGFVLFLLLFDPLKRQLQTTIEQRFFPQRRDYSSTLVAFSDQASQTVRTEDVAHLIGDVLARTLNLSDVCVVLWDSSHQPIIASRVCHLHDAPEIDTLAVASLRQHFRQHNTLLALDTIGDDALNPLRTHYLYAIELCTRDTSRGTVLIGEPNDGSMLNSRQVQFISAIAAQGSAALEIARLLEKEIARQRYLEELATARRIQQNILPASLPAFPGISVSALSNPAQTVGGDYFNVIQLDDEHVLVIVADVSGKGLPASFYMAELHGMVCIASTTCATPSQMLATINDHLYREMPRGTFITATALLFDTERRQLSLARAGHTPLIYRNHNGTVSLTPPGPALGFVRGHSFLSMLREERIDYVAGDTFILYSDGISEMMNGGKEEFGDERLRDLVENLKECEAESIRDTIVQTVDGFRNGAEQHDDVTIVVVQANQEVQSSKVLPVEHAVSL